MKANISAMRETAKNFPRKRNGFTQEIAVIDPSNGRAILIARFYRPGTQVTCLLWMHGKTYGRGIGRAGGYGYHMPSAALADAIDDAGINLSAPISGYGDSRMIQAAEAIARAATGKRRLITHIAHA